MRTFEIADLFCGVGGLSLGFADCGFKLNGAYDNWDNAVTIYNNNFTDHKCEKLDLSAWARVAEILKTLNVDGIVGGPPCQDFSSAGKRDEGKRADLTVSFANIVFAVRPRFFVMENVATAKNSLSFARAKDILSNQYFFSEHVLTASYFGVPQRRKRFFCVGFLEPEIARIFEKHLLKQKSDKEMTIADYFGADLDIYHYYRHPRNYNRRAVYSIHEPAATIRGVNRPVPENYPGHHLDTTSKDEVRPLNTMERSRVQTFPKNFKWSGTKTDIEQMIGNAVPPRLAYAVASAIRNSLVEYDQKLIRAA